MISEGMIRTIAIALANTGYNYYFVGGAASVFYIDDDNASKMRPTNIIDCLIEIYGDSEFVEFEEKIKNLGFTPVQNGHNTCRYQYKGILVDMIPSKSKQILGFENKWYEKGIDNALSRNMGDIEIKYFPLHYYIASKLEALNNRGMGDLMSSRDFEDIVIIMDGIECLTIINDFPEEIIHYIKEMLLRITKQSNFRDALIEHIDISPVREQRAQRIIDFMGLIIK